MAHHQVEGAILTRLRKNYYHPMKLRLFPLLFPALGVLAGACSGPYTVTLNEAVVYSPNPDRAAGLLEDANLQGCVNQAMRTGGNDNEDPASITTLACPDAGIRSLAGIDALVNLEQLDLSGNSISNLAPLSTLNKLRVLSLRNNAISSITPLMSLPILRFVQLQGNEGIPCRQLDNLQEKIGSSTLGRPTPCS